MGFKLFSKRPYGKEAANEAPDGEMRVPFLARAFPRRVGLSILFASFVGAIAELLLVRNPVYLADCELTSVELAGLYGMYTTMIAYPAITFAAAAQAAWRFERNFARYARDEMPAAGSSSEARPNPAAGHRASSWRFRLLQLLGSGGAAPPDTAREVATISDLASGKWRAGASVPRLAVFWAVHAAVALIALLFAGVMTASIIAKDYGTTSTLDLGFFLPIVLVLLLTIGYSVPFTLSLLPVARAWTARTDSLMLEAHVRSLGTSRSTAALAAILRVWRNVRPVSARRNAIVTACASAVFRIAAQFDPDQPFAPDTAVNVAHVLRHARHSDVPALLDLLERCGDIRVVRSLEGWRQRQHDPQIISRVDALIEMLNSRPAPQPGASEYLRADSRRDLLRSSHEPQVETAILLRAGAAGDGETVSAAAAVTEVKAADEPAVTRVLG